MSTKEVGVNTKDVITAVIAVTNSYSTSICFSFLLFENFCCFAKFCKALWLTEQLHTAFLTQMLNMHVLTKKVTMLLNLIIITLSLWIIRHYNSLCMSSYYRDNNCCLTVQLELLSKPCCYAKIMYTFWPISFDNSDTLLCIWMYTNTILYTNILIFSWM